MTDPEQANTLTLRCTRGSMQGQTLQVESGTRVGRSPGCEIVVSEQTDTKVSGSHGLIERHENGWTYTDLGSTNGSLVNGRPVQANQPEWLQDGCTVELGEDGSAGTVCFAVSLPGGAGGGEVAVVCPGCGATFGAPTSMMGRTVACPSCGAGAEVPVSAKLFGGSPAPSVGLGPSAPIGSGRAAPPPPPGASQATGQAPGQAPGQAGGIFGKVKSAVKNFQEKREVQQQLAAAEQGQRGLATRRDADLVALGRHAWATSREACGALPGGSQLAEVSGEMDRLERELAELESTHAGLVEQLEQDRAAWNERVASAEADREACAGRAAEADDAVRAARGAYDEALRSCLEGVIEAGKGVADLAGQGPGDDARAKAEAALERVRDEANEAAGSLGELDEPTKAHARALASAERARAALAEADEALAEANARRAEAVSEAEAAVREASGGVEAVRREASEEAGKVEPFYHMLGQAVLERGGEGVVDAGHEAYARAAGSHADAERGAANITHLRGRLSTLSGG